MEKKNIYSVDWGVRKHLPQHLHAKNMRKGQGAETSRNIIEPFAIVDFFHKDQCYDMKDARIYTQHLF